MLVPLPLIIFRARITIWEARRLRLYRLARLILELIQKLGLSWMSWNAQNCSTGTKSWIVERSILHLIIILCWCLTTAVSLCQSYGNSIDSLICSNVIIILILIIFHEFLDFIAEWQNSIIQIGIILLIVMILIFEWLRWWSPLSLIQCW